MCRIGGRLGSQVVRSGGADGEIPLLFDFDSNLRPWIRGGDSARRVV